MKSKIQNQHAWHLPSSATLSLLVSSLLLQWAIFLRLSHADNARWRFRLDVDRRSALANKWLS